MVGMAMKNENSAAARRSTPISTPPTMVAPERETPGTMARHWNIPMPRARFHDICMASSSFGAGAQRSMTSRTIPPRISITQIRPMLSNSTVLMKSWARKAIPIEGMIDRITLAANQRAFGSLGRRMNMPQSRWK